MKIERKLSWTFGEPAPPWVSWIGLLFLLVGLGLLAGSFWFYQKEAKFAHTAVSASGTVIDLIRKRNHRRDNQGFTRNKILYSPVVQFIDQQGQSKKLYSTGGSNPPSYRRGEKVTVLYDPDNPEIAIIDDWQRYIGNMIVGGLGLVFSLVGLFVIGVFMREKLTTLKARNQ